MTWRAFNLQLVWFGQSALSAPDLFRGLAGSDPASSTTFAAPHGPTSNASGRVSAYDINVSVQPMRTDLVLSQAEDRALDQQDGPHAIDSLQSALSLFTEIVDNLEISNVSRFALIANVGKLLDNLDDAGRVTLDAIGYALPFDDVSDVIFKINRRMTVAALPGVGINRVLTWQTEIFQKLQVQVPVFGAGAMMAAPIQGRTHPAVTVNVDLNSAPDLRRLFPHSELRTMFQALRQELLRLYDALSPSALADV